VTAVLPSLLLQEHRKGSHEIKVLVDEVQRLRSEHFTLMKKLHAKEVTKRTDAAPSE
jgi:hypothetical protein